MSVSGLSSSSSIPIYRKTLSQQVSTADTIRRRPFKTPEQLSLRPISQYKFINKKYAYYIELENKNGGEVPYPARVHSTYTSYRAAKRCMEEILSSVDAGKWFFLSDDNPTIVHFDKYGDQQYLWQAIQGCTSPETFEVVAHLVNQHDQSVFLNTGTHGNNLGYTSNDSANVANRAESWIADREVSLILDQRLFIEKDRPKMAYQIVTRDSPSVYPAGANHIIDTWCHSFVSRFTDPDKLQTSIHKSMGAIPVHFFCSYGEKLIQKPYYFLECKMIGGQRHYFDKSSISKIRDLVTFLMPHKPASNLTAQERFEMRMKEQEDGLALEYRCPFKGCREMVVLNNATYDRKFQGVINNIRKLRLELVGLKFETNLKAHKILLQDKEIVELKSERNGLRSENAKVKKENTELKTNLDKANKETTQVKKVVKVQSEKIDELSQRVEKQAIKIVILREGSTFDSFVNNSSFIQERGISQLRPVLQYQLQSSENRIEEIFKGTKRGAGRGFFGRRPNAFVKPTEVFDTELTVKTNLLVTLFLKTKSDHLKTETTVALESYDVGPVGLLSGSVVYAGFTPLKLSDLEKESFLNPLMDRLIRADRVSSRLMEWMKHHKVSIEINTKVVSWDKNKEEHEGWPTVFPKTYEQTIAQVLKTCLRFEVADSMLKNLQIS